MNHLPSATGLFIALLFSGQLLAQPDETISKAVKQQPARTLTANVMNRGNAARGAVFFHRSSTQCAKCHATSASTSNQNLGPTLVDATRKDSTREYLIQSMIEPSKVIRKGFETTIVTTEEGKVFTGIIINETATQLTIANSPDESSIIDKSDIEERETSTASTMPEGLIDNLQSVQDFYDLAKYVIEVAEKGEAHAATLRPARELLVESPLPEYEKDLDHRGLVSALDDDAFERGEKVYERVCANCHGNHDRIGSLPTAPQFARLGDVEEGQRAQGLKRGTEPWKMYQTLTDGYGMMVAQRWMVPSQKYDVIHFIREEFFREDNPENYFTVTDKYIASLPTGSTRGPEPQVAEPYVTMNYGPFLINTYEMVANTDGEEVGRNLGRGPDPDDPKANPDRMFSADDQPNFAYKGIAIRLDEGAGGVSRGKHWMVYDHDTMNMHGAWSGDAFIDYCAIQFDGRHGTHARLGSELQVANEVGPGWQHPTTKEIADPRPTGRDGRYYGPLPGDWLKYHGLYDCGERTVLSYSVGDHEILESPGVVETADGAIFTRDFSVFAKSPISVRICPEDLHATVAVHLSGNASAPMPMIARRNGSVWCDIPGIHAEQRLSIAFSRQEIPDDFRPQECDLAKDIKPENLTKDRWPEVVETNIEPSVDGPFVVDHLTVPESNPWNCRVRCTGHDFVNANTAAVCTWDGDVWLVSDILTERGVRDRPLRWRRIASGMFQPLGLKIVDGVIYVTCRDQIVALRDLNGDGHTDFYECFNNDHQVTEHFHEFAMGLQTDKAGNFYYAKSARHAKRAVVPHHGTLLRVAADGSKTDIIATGFRAANGVCLNPDGSFFVTDQEGHWNPKNRINWVSEGKFYGNMYGFTDETNDSDDAMQPPLCWITNSFDRSPAELLWVPKNHWGNLGGSLLNLSYGYGRAYIVPHEKKNDKLQGGMCGLPIPDFPSGLVRGRFDRSGENLFLCSMFVWSSNQQEPGGFHRIRYRGKGSNLPTALRAFGNTIEIQLSDEVSRDSANDPENFSVNSWDIKRTARYGSDHFNEKELEVTRAELQDDGRTIRLTIPSLKPTWCMAIEMRLTDKQGKPFEREIHNTIHSLD